MKVCLKGFKNQCWHQSMELIIVDGRNVSDRDTRKLVNYGIAHGCETFDDIPEDVLRAILDADNKDYSEYEDNDTRLVSEDRVRKVLMSFNINKDEIDEIIETL